jgi:hypothetical protein
MSKPSRETLRKRIGTRRSNAAKRKRMRARREARILAKGGPEAARQRLDSDGASSNEAIWRRILWFANEHKLPPAEIQEAMAGRLDNVTDFIQRHGISYDWMFLGDLKGLLRMPMKQSPHIFKVTDVARFYAELTMEQRRQITLTLATLVQANTD